MRCKWMFKLRALWPWGWLRWLALWLVATPLAYADIWGYVDANGVAHVASERVDERYTLFARGGASFDSRSVGVPSAGDTADAPGGAGASKLLTFFEISPNYKAVKHHLRAASQAHGVDYALLQAVISTESGFDPAAVSPKGAVGLMQVMPDTAKRFGLVADKKVSLETKLFDPKVNIGVGTRYLQVLLQQFGGQVHLALAAYNAGEGSVRRAGNQIPPFKETQNYVHTVLGLYTQLKPPAAITPARPVQRVRAERLPQPDIFQF